MSTLRTRFGIPGVIATVALVFAMTGGAFAAKYLITSTKQISPSVLKKLKGAAGPAGAAGAAGAQGLQGPAGTDGKDGTSGKNGESVTLAAASVGECPTGGTKLTVGAESKAVCNGAKGEKGTKGDPWTAGGVLPSEKTETGSFATLFVPVPFPLTKLAISFPIPLAASIAAANTHFIESGGLVPAGCTGGTAEAPKADPGHLCVYGAKIGGSTAVFAGFENSGKVGIADQGTSKTGIVINFLGNPEEEFSENKGTWAVTAPEE